MAPGEFLPSVQRCAECLAAWLQTKQHKVAPPVFWLGGSYEVNHQKCQTHFVSQSTVTEVLSLPPPEGSAPSEPLAVLAVLLYRWRSHLAWPFSFPSELEASVPFAGISPGSLNSGNPWPRSMGRCWRSTSPATSFSTCQGALCPFTHPQGWMAPKHL